MPTNKASGIEVALELPLPMAVADITTDPRVDGRQVQVETILGVDPEVDLFLHPGKTFPLIINETLEAALIFAVIVTLRR